MVTDLPTGSREVSCGDYYLSHHYDLCRRNSRGVDGGREVVLFWGWGREYRRDFNKEVRKDGEWDWLSECWVFVGVRDVFEMGRILSVETSI